MGSTCVLAADRVATQRAARHTAALPHRRHAPIARLAPRALTTGSTPVPYGT